MARPWELPRSSRGRWGPAFHWRRSSIAARSAFLCGRPWVVLSALLCCVCTVVSRSGGEWDCVPSLRSTAQSVSTVPLRAGDAWGREQVCCNAIDCCNTARSAGGLASIPPTESIERCAAMKGQGGRVSRRLLGAASAVLAVLRGSPMLPAEALMTDERQVTSLFERTTPGVVSISREPPGPLGANERAPGPGSISGSGFVWDKDHVVTNAHVISNLDHPYVTFLMPSTPTADQKSPPDRRTTLDAVVVGSDVASDVAVLRVLNPGGVPTGAAPATQPPTNDLMQPLAKGSSANLLVGQNVFAFGNPFGLEHSLSRGIISGVRRKMDGAGGRPITGVIQTDASINPGNSGGPLLNSDGQVIGVNTAILTGSGAFSGVGLAIPIDTVQRNVESIIAKGFVRRPLLGIVFAPDVMSEELQLNGIMVMKVAEGSPAAAAQVRPMRGGRLGDVVVAMEGKRIRSTDDLFAVLEQRSPGDVIKMVVQRATADAESDKYEEKELSVTLGVADGS